MSTNHVRRSARFTMPLFALDPCRGVIVELIAGVFPARPTWNSAIAVGAAR